MTGLTDLTRQVLDCLSDRSLLISPHVLSLLLSLEKVYTSDLETQQGNDHKESGYMETSQLFLLHGIILQRTSSERP